MNVPYKKEIQLGYGALVLIVAIFVILIVVSGIEIEVEDEPEENTSTYHGGSPTLKKLNDFGELSCDQCLKNCQWTTLRSEERCRESCVPQEDCDPSLDIRLG